MIRVSYCVYEDVDGTGTGDFLARFDTLEEARQFTLGQMTEDGYRIDGYSIVWEEDDDSSFHWATKTLCHWPPSWTHMAREEEGAVMAAARLECGDEEEHVWFAQQQALRDLRYRETRLYPVA